jgi:hypothetical protein
MRYHRTFLGIGLALGALGLTQLALPGSAAAQQSAAAPLTRAQLDELRTRLNRLMRQEQGLLNALQRQVEVRFFGPPEEEGEEPRGITAFVFVPKRTDGAERGSLVVWQRGADELEIESWSDVPELRELVGRGVTVIAPAYRGAPEERLEAVPEYALARYPFLDPGSVSWREAS